MKPESFPSWIYHATEPAYICMTEAEFDALPAEWADHPDRVPKAVVEWTEPVIGVAETAEAPKRRGRPPKAE